MNVVIAIITLVVGIVAGGYGILVAADPEGRGGLYVLLIPVGALGAAGYLIFLGARALFGG